VRVGSCVWLAAAAPGPGVFSAANRNSIRSKNNSFLEIERGRCLTLTSPPSVSRLCRQCRILNISQPYRTPLPHTGITLLFVCRLCSYLTGNAFHGLLRRQLSFSVCRYCSYLIGNIYGHPQPVTGTTLIFYVYIMFLPYRKHTYSLPRPVTEITFTFLPSICVRSCVLVQRTRTNINIKDGSPMRYSVACHHPAPLFFAYKT
jgi:hypothetical protein